MNLLFYVEPHPVRNSYTEWFHVATLLSPVLAKYAAGGNISCRIFSNNAVIDKLLNTIPAVISHLQRPTITESKFIDAQFEQWNAASIAKWLDLVAGRGPVAEFYLSVVERMHAALPIDVILTWSENGALRKFSERTGVPVIFGELGPTRPPFVETMYFDRGGTNGNAFFRKTTRKLIEECDRATIPSSQSWLISSDKKIDKPETVRSLIDLPSTFDRQFQDVLPSKKYVYIPLQLADDLNTLMHSKFKTPKDFLINVLPRVAEAGYAAVIKGHPGAEARPYNMRHEIEALQYAEESGFDVVIIPRKAPPDLSAYVLGNASYTMSINSSVSFESMLLGVPALVMGAAAFDANGWLQENISLRPADQQHDYSAVMDMATAVHMQSVFVPKDIVLDSDYLFGLFREVTTDTADFTNALLIGNSVSAPVIPYLGAASVRRGDTIVVRNGSLFIHRKGDPSAVLELRLSRMFFGHLDLCQVHGDNNLLLSGWAIDEKTGRPPMQLIVTSGSTIVSAHRINHRREDVVSEIPDLQGTLCGFSVVIENVKSENLSLVLVGYDGQGQIITHLKPGLQLHETGGAAEHPDA
jgi:hypothetical protein